MPTYPLHAVFPTSAPEGLGPLLRSASDEVVELETTAGPLLIAQVQDFEPDVYDRDGPTASEASERRDLVVAAMDALLDAGAVLVRVSGAADNYAGIPGHEERGALLADAVVRRDEDAVNAELRAPLYTWLLALPPGPDAHRWQGPKSARWTTTPKGRPLREDADAGPLFAEP